MSDRTQGSVRAESPAADGGSKAASRGISPKGGSSAGTPKSARSTTGTQSIPTTGAQRAQGPATNGAPVDPSAAAPVVSPPTGGSVAAAPETATGTAKAPAKDRVQSPADDTVQSPASDTAGNPVTGSAKDADAATETEVAGGPAPRGNVSARAGGRGPRRARLQLRHIDTWSALKVSLVLSIALFFIWMVAVGVLYGVLNSLGVFDTLNDLFGQIGSASGSDTGGDVVTPGLVFGGAAMIGAINIVLLTALCTVGTFIYNLCSDLVGGLEVTLSERD